MARLPLIAQMGRAINHHGAVGLNALAVEGGSHDAPLALMYLTVAGDEPLAEQDLHAPLGSLLDEVLRLVDENLVDKFGLIDEDDVREAQPVVGHVPKSLCQML